MADNDSADALLDDEDDHKMDANAVPLFISKLITMIEDPTIQHIISWSQSGDTFLVHNVKALESVLPRFFNHNKFNSLVRQLNMYGFHKVVSEAAPGSASKVNDMEWEFVHPCVHRGKPEMLKHIKRKHDNSSNRRKQMTKNEIEKILQNLSFLQQQHSQMVTKYHEMQQQNQSLWLEVSSLRTAHDQQQWKIARIMQFLARLVQLEEGPGAAQGQLAKRRKLAIDSGLSDVMSQMPGEPQAPMDMTTDPQMQAMQAMSSSTPWIPDLSLDPSQFDSRLHETRNILELHHGIDAGFLPEMFSAPPAAAAASAPAPTAEAPAASLGGVTLPPFQPQMEFNVSNTEAKAGDKRPAADNYVVYHPLSPLPSLDFP